VSVDDPFDPVLVTGAAGFIGANAVRALLARGHTVHAVVRPGPDPWRLRGLNGPVTSHRLDLADAEAVHALLRRTRPGAVVHLATYGAYERQTDFRAMVGANVLGTFHLLEAAEAAGVRAFVSAGSSSEYGFKAEPMRETDRLDPNSLYAVAKAAQAHLCGLAARRGTGGMGVATFRVFSAYGPWEEPSRLIPTLLRRARANLPLEMVAPDVARDFVYVDDVTDALLDLPRVAGLRGEVINLGTGVETTLSEVVAAVLELTGSRSEVAWGAMPPRRWDTDRWVADPLLAARLIGWRAGHGLRQGLAKMAAWMGDAGYDDQIGPVRGAG
jgi:nucleoside-diphosphate-sugar epimerase